MDYEKLSDKRLGETSTAIRGRVEAASKRQRERFKVVEGVTCNAEMRPAEIREYCELDAAGQSLIKAAMRQLNLGPGLPQDTEAVAHGCGPGGE